MSRPSKPKITSTKFMDRNELAFSLFFLGRCGKLLEEAGAVPGETFFTIGNTNSDTMLEQFIALNPSSGLTKYDYEHIWKRAVEYAVEKFKTILPNHKRRFLAREPFLALKDLYFEDNKVLRKYFENVCDLSESQWASICHLATHEYNRHLNLSYRCNQEEGTVQVTRTPHHIRRSHTMSKSEIEKEILDGVIVKNIPKIGFKLTSYAKKALQNYMKELENKQASFDISYSSSVISVPVEGKRYSFNHHDVRVVKNKLLEAFNRMFLNYIQDATCAFKQTIIEDQDFILNGVKLSRELKKMLLDRIKIHPSLNGLNYLSKVLRVLRDKRNINCTAQDLLTADSEKERQVGLVLAKILESKEEEESEDEKA